MTAPTDNILETTVGDFPLHEYRLHKAGQTWSVLHTGAMLTRADETHFFRTLRDRLPYGVALWPASVVLAHEVAERGEVMRGARVLELGAGTGIPGIVAASLGAHVTQTDRHELAMAVCQRNAARNGVTSITYRLVNWTAWDDTTRYDYILGSDILYDRDTHGHLQHIFEHNLAAGGRILLTDPYRDTSIELLERMEAAGWAITLSKWDIGEDDALRPIGLFGLTPPTKA
jgi:methyltransferase-like protein 23